MQTELPELIESDPPPAAEEPAAVESLRNAPPIPRAGPRSRPSEREEDASALLLRSQQRDAWVERAEWLRAEAGALSDLDGRARALLVVSELYAMAGEEATARAVADEAREIAPSLPLPHRQTRGILARDGNWAGVVEVLEAESKSIPTPEARCHGALFGAEIARICQGDEESAKKRFDQAQRVAPADPRAHAALLRGARRRRRRGRRGLPVTKVRIPDAPELASLAAAAQQVAAHRGLTGTARRAPGTSYESLSACARPSPQAITPAPSAGSKGSRATRPSRAAPAGSRAWSRLPEGDARALGHCPARRARRLARLCGAARPRGPRHRARRRRRGPLGDGVDELGRLQPGRSHRARRPHRGPALRRRSLDRRPARRPRARADRLRRQRRARRSDGARSRRLPCGRPARAHGIHLGRAMAATGEGAAGCSAARSSRSSTPPLITGRLVRWPSSSTSTKATAARSPAPSPRGVKTPKASASAPSPER